MCFAHAEELLSNRKLANSLIFLAARDYLDKGAKFGFFGSQESWLESPSSSLRISFLLESLLGVLYDRDAYLLSLI